MTRCIIVLGDNACGGCCLYSNGVVDEPHLLISLVMENRDKSREDLKKVLINFGFKENCLTGNALAYALTGCEYLFHTQHRENGGPLSDFIMLQEVCLFGGWQPLNRQPLPEPEPEKKKETMHAIQWVCPMCSTTNHPAIPHGEPKQSIICCVTCGKLLFDNGYASVAWADCSKGDEWESIDIKWNCPHCHRQNHFRLSPAMIKDDDSHVFQITCLLCGKNPILDSF